MSSGADPPYQLAWSGRILKQVQAWAMQAKQLGIRSAYIELLKTLNEALTTQPLTWGDPQFRYPHFELRQFIRLEQGFQIAYAVDEARRIVYITRFMPLSGHPLSE